MPSPSTSPSKAPSHHASNLSPGVIVMFVGLGVPLLGIVAFAIWWKATRRELLSPRFIRRHYRSADAVSARDRWQRGDGDGDDDGSRKKPVIFDARTGLQMVDVSNWEESVPVSGTLFTEVAALANKRKAKKHLASTQSFGGDDDDDDIDEGTEERQPAREDTSTDTQLQVAVLVQMPSPRRKKDHDDKVDESTLERPVRGELAIGTTEVPWAWAGGDHYSQTQKCTTMSSL